MPGGFVVRVATREDDARVSELLKASYPVLMASSYCEAVLAGALPLMTRANAMLLSAGTYYLAVSDNGSFVGCGGWTRERPGSGEVAPVLAHIRHFATHPDWIGRGIGRAIYVKCECEARSGGVQRFECYSSLNAEGFYATLGFHPIRQIALPMGQVELPSILMERLI